MPRPPVPPELRQRASKACGPCRAAKRRCDALLQCSACTKRGISCHWPYPSFDDPSGTLNRVSSGRVSKAGSVERPRSFQRWIHEDVNEPSCPTDQSSRLLSNPPSSIEPGLVSPEGGSSQASPRVPVVARSRMLVNARGERGRN